MPSRIELINNSYVQRLQVLRNGEPVSEYSSIKRYMDQPFCDWCDKIFDVIYEEYNNEPFFLHFSSRREELQIMEVLSQKYSYCLQYSSSPTENTDSLQKRMTALSSILKHSLVYTRIFKHSALFILPESMRELEAELRTMTVKNSFCQIETDVKFYKDARIDNNFVGTIFLLVDEENNVEDVMSRLNLNRDFGIQFSRSVKSSFVSKSGNMFIYRTNENELFQTIFDCLMLRPLLEIFRSCIAELPSEIANRNVTDLEKLQSISAKIIPIVESNVIELGRSIRIRFESDMPDYRINVSQLNFVYSEKDVIKCNGLVIEGLREGTSSMYIYRQGENDPFSGLEFRVIKRNRITDLFLEHSDIVIGEGDKFRLGLKYEPIDADNVDKITWQSDSPEIAKIDLHGNVQGIKRGTCVIRCFAEQVSSSCRCVVKPHLKKIVPSESEIDIIRGNSEAIYIRLSPENCIDDEIVFSSMDMRVANVIGRRVQAVDFGTTKIVIQNRNETVRADVIVNVVSEREYRKRQKRKLKEQSSSGGSKGWIARLLGWDI